MRRVLSLAGAAALALLVGSASAEAQTLRFTALLSGANEVPGIASGSGGTATVTLNTATRAVTYKVDVYNTAFGRDRRRTSTSAAQAWLVRSSVEFRR